MQSSPSWLDQAARFSLIGATLFVSVALYGSLSQSWEKPERVVSRSTSKRIEDAQLGERVLGRNPVRDQADTVEPDPETWCAVSLHIRKPSGKSLWIELLRPQAWLEAVDAKVGQQIFLDLHEMGAVGDADVLAIRTCPEIEPGPGAIITGTFKHEADSTTQVVRIQIQDQLEPVGVTSNHRYWSITRKDFVPVGELRVGELVDSEQGPKQVLSVVPVAYQGLLYNFETNEHVYRIGSIGTLVHNSCHAHHPIPKFLGGDLLQDFSKLPPAVHREFHRELRANLRAKSIPLNIGGRGGSAADWARYMRANPGTQREALDAVLDASRMIDGKHGTNITRDVWSNLVHGRFTVYP